MNEYQFSEKDRKRIEEVRSKSAELAKDAKRKSKAGKLEEPVGKQTNPNDLDRVRDRKNEQ